MWIISTIFSLISIILYLNNIHFLLYIGVILVVIDNFLNIKYGKQNNYFTLILAILLGFIYSLCTSSPILITICLYVCCGNLIEGILGIFLLIFEARLYNQNFKIKCPHCNSKNNPKRKRCYMCGKKLYEEKNTDNQDAYQQFLKDNFSNNGTKTYIKDIKIQSNNTEDNTEHSKLIYILNILKREINVEDVDDAIHQLYEFYVENDVDIPIDWISYSESCNNNQKLEILLKILQTGMGTSNIDDTIEVLERFYKEQHISNKQIRNINNKENEINQLKENIRTLKQTYEKAKEDLGNNTIEKFIDMYTNNLITEEQKDALINAIEGLNTIIKTYPSLITDFENKLKDLEENE